VLVRASDLAALAALRGRLRAQIATSALFDGPRFARDWLETVHGLWHESVSG
jgi:predicted O-linked N-acetylglucosamine transferase (SPINDLY family)